MQACIENRKFSYPEIPSQGKFGTKRDGPDFTYGLQ
jgi:hypothetical protein